MFRHTAETLRARGLERYEVSNFAMPGHESRHNIAYWIQEQWLGAGPSASAHVWGGRDMRAGSWRYKNVPRLGDYLDSTGWSPVVDVERPDPLRLARERIMMGVRLGAGLETSGLMVELRAFSPASAAALERAAGRQAGRGSMTIDGTRWTLTDAGMLVCDGVAADLMGSVRASVS
jgi:oxygen-independent coproporphyrinogen-3 oxidase